ncbi:MAG: DUF1127 domain-containing protein [Kiloniellaceae bacterium]
MLHATPRKNSSFLPRTHGVFGGGAATLLRAPGVLLDRLATWQRQSEERAHLLRLADHELQDMGLSRGAAEDMARKAIWNR